LSIFLKIFLVTSFHIEEEAIFKTKSQLAFIFLFKLQLLRFSLINMKIFNSKTILLSLGIMIILVTIIGCSTAPASLPATLIITTLSSASVTAESTLTPIPTETVQPLPDDLAQQKIDGLKITTEYDPRLKTWVWKNKKEEIRRLLEPLNNHLLARTSVEFDRLTYDIDLAFKWEVNLVNYANYGAHAPFGIAYIQLLKLKYPELIPQADENTGIVFRILQGSLQDIADPSQVSYSADMGTEEERAFLKPVYSPATNEYILTLFLLTDLETRPGAINTYTDWMLNFCLTPQYPQNPTGSWGVAVYKHIIK
jgi:hypothetical protein